MCDVWETRPQAQRRSRFARPWPAFPVVHPTLLQPPIVLLPVPSSAAPVERQDPSACGCLQWPRPRRRPPPRDSRGRPPSEGHGEGCAEVKQWPISSTPCSNAASQIRSPLPFLLRSHLTQLGTTPLYWAQKNRRTAAAALLQADPRVAAALEGAEHEIA